MRSRFRLKEKDVKQGHTFLLKILTSFLPLALSASTMAFPRPPVPPATAMTTMVYDSSCWFYVEEVQGGSCK